MPDHLCLNNNAQNLIFINRDNTEHNDSLVTGQKASPAAPVVPGIDVSPGKGDPKVTNGQNRETNIDINKPTDQSPQQQQLLSSAKSVNPPASGEPSVASLIPTAEPQQQGAYSEPSNASVSQNTNVSSGSTPSEPPRTSSNVSVGMLILSERASLCVCICVCLCLCAYVCTMFCHAASGPPPQLVRPDHLWQILLP